MATVKGRRVADGLRDHVALIRERSREVMTLAEALEDVPLVAVESTPKGVDDAVGDAAKDAQVSTPAAEAATGGKVVRQSGVAAGGMTWEEAQQKAEAHVKSHSGAFPSTKRLAESVGCSRATICKAVAASPYLKARKAEAKAKAEDDKKPREVQLSDAAWKAAEDSNSDTDVLNRLIDQQDKEAQREERQHKKWVADGRPDR